MSLSGQKGNKEASYYKEALILKSKKIHLMSTVVLATTHLFFRAH